MHIAKMFFSKFRSPHFCTVFSTICGTVVKKKKMSQRGIVFQVFGTPWPILRLRRGEVEIFGSGDASQNSRVLPRVVCLCGAVSV